MEGQKSMAKRLEVIFMGNESPFLDCIRKRANLICIVGDPMEEEQKKWFGSAYDYAHRNGIPVVSSTAFLRFPKWCLSFCDLIIVFGFPKLIPLRVINHSIMGIVNIHQSLLPKYRGRHPLNWVIINGEKETGVTIHCVTERFDEGNILYQTVFLVDENNTTMQLYDRTVWLGEDLLDELFDDLEQNGKLHEGVKQNEEEASYFPPRKPEDGLIDWSKSPEEIRNLARALREPYPGAFFWSDRRKVVIDDIKIRKIGDI